MEVLRVWLTGVKNMFVGDFEREQQRLESAKQSSTKLRAIKNLNLPPAGDEGTVHKSVMDKTREITNIYPTPSRRDITHNRLEALNARFAEQ
ncbi:MAG: hypothetical protein K2Y39_22015 [Candidatus Obscuribacterales bacterium]|nr:hypothetical protein [Candidatus Obscuribacterales bacterium]